MAQSAVPTVRHLSERWGRTWPALLGVLVVASVGAPAAVASWRHAKTVIERSGDPVMAPWLALSTDGMLVAALVVIWVRRHRGESAGVGPWAAFWAGMAATVAANLAAAPPTPEGYVVALWPPVCLAIALELVALIAYRTRPAAVMQVETAPAGPEPALEELEAKPAEEDPIVEKARELVAAGAGRPRLVKELEVTDHQARQLLEKFRQPATSTTNGKVVTA